MSTQRNPRPQSRRPVAPVPASDPPRLEATVDVTAIAAGGDGVARPVAGRGVFVARGAFGDRLPVVVPGGKGALRWREPL